MSQNMSRNNDRTENIIVEGLELGKYPPAIEPTDLNPDDDNPREVFTPDVAYYNEYVAAPVGKSVGNRPLFTQKHYEAIGLAFLNRATMLNSLFEDACKRYASYEGDARTNPDILMSFQMIEAKAHEWLVLWNTIADVFFRDNARYRHTEFSACCNKQEVTQILDQCGSVICALKGM